MAKTVRRKETFLPSGAIEGLQRQFVYLAGLGLVIVATFLALVLFSYNPRDPSLNGTGGLENGSVTNLLNMPGAILADFLVQTTGYGAWIPVVLLVLWGLRLILSGRGLPFVWLRLLVTPVGWLLACVPLSAASLPGQLPNGAGGVAGLVLTEGMMRQALAWGLGGSARFIVLMAATSCAVIVLSFASSLSWSGVRNARSSLGQTREKLKAVGNIAVQRRKVVPTQKEEGTKKARRSFTDLVVSKRASSKKKPVQVEQKSLKLEGDVDGVFELPSPSLLAQVPNSARTLQVNEEGLAQNARLLEAALHDFGIKGDIVKIRPGPVVTLYELEPAAGTRASRVIGLADDIARSMSALSVRIAMIPGRSVIGIELPNMRRETVYLRELLETKDFNAATVALPLLLGKDIGGTPVVADLARMPHLLIAGTTGSGKSVAVNTMILSLLYRLPPEQCRMVMIDPKMLELSVYDGIPHLLTPVVTDPAKAVLALKWTVREMENRYRAMSQLGVRNITGFNQRLEEVKLKGEKLNRTVQTGFDPETGEPVYEEQGLKLEPLPYIVVVVDEMADLMMVAGKEIEAAIQRLAQMARAAGIHLIMATQRPSVDVITGTIKANFPTRISFQVTSKIDSRTILGEGGAEQLLGQGDMLYMASGGRVIRVHGPFVSDGEVEGVVAFLRTQRGPVYEDSVTEEEPAMPDTAMPGAPGDALYDQAVDLVAREGKVSTSFVQRYLQIGYNRAARIIERMEAEGVISRANHAGKREVLARRPSDE